MRSRHILPVVILAMLLGLAARAARAEEVIETWRNPFGHLRSVSVNSTDSSIWVASGGSVLHLASDGTILSQTNGFAWTGAVAVNEADGSCWVDDGQGGGWPHDSDLVHLAEDGTEILRLSGLLGTLSLSVNPVDGSCWVGEAADRGDLVHFAEDGTELWRGIDLSGRTSVNPTDGSCWVATGGQVVHFAADGTELWRAGIGAGTASVNPTDGSCWVASSSEVIHLAEDGTELLRVARACEDLSVNPTDGSCWVGGGTEVVHLAEDGTELWRGAGFEFGNRVHGAVSVNSSDGSCWLIHIGGVGYHSGLELVHLSESGAELWTRTADFYTITDISASPVDGSCWVSDNRWPATNQTVHLAADGTELWRGSVGGRYLSANSVDGSCWVGGPLDRLSHLGADGAELLRISGLTYTHDISVNPTDGSCWVAVADYSVDTGELLHLAEDGAVLLRFANVDYPWSLAANPADGSCWVAQAAADTEVVHVAQDGTELWRGGPTNTTAVSVDPVDGSCWVYLYSSEDRQVVHLAEDGTELWRGVDLGYVHSLSVSPFDGSCWVGGDTAVIHLAEDGTELWRGGKGGDVSFNPMDGSCWVADSGNGQVIRLEVVGYEGPHFPDIMPYHWAFDEVEACADSAIVGGYGDGLYHPDWTLSRDQMAVFISRSIATPTGEVSLDDYVPPTTPSFSDIPTDFWCYKYIEYAVEHDIVGGYGDGTYQPQVTIDRGQMAVFIARAMAGDDESVPDPVGDPSFPDVPADFWSYRHIEYIADQEVAGGYYDGLYHPETFVTRDQMAVFICRAFDLSV
jgi:hypothetical protein